MFKCEIFRLTVSVYKRSGEDDGCNQGKVNIIINNLKSGFDFSFSIAVVVGTCIMQLKITFDFFLDNLQYISTYALHVCPVEQEFNFDSNFDGLLHGIFLPVGGCYTQQTPSSPV